MANKSYTRTKKIKEKKNDREIVYRKCVMFDFMWASISQSMQSWYAHSPKKEESIILLLWNNNDNSIDLCRLWWYYAIEFDWFVCWVRFFQCVRVSLSVFAFFFVSLHQFPTNWVIWCKMCDKTHAIRLNKDWTLSFPRSTNSLRATPRNWPRTNKYYR